MGILSSLISGGFSYGASNKAAEAQLEAAKIQAGALNRQASLQYEANMEQIAAQKEENLTAYRRNSISAQMAQLVAAGLSEQQARQIITGATPGQYTPAEIRSTMEGVDTAAGVSALAAGQAQAAQQLAQGLSAFGQDLGAGLGQIEDAAVGTFMSAVSSSMNDPKGGVLGALQSNHFQNVFCEHFNELPALARGSYGGFKRWLASSEGESFRPVFEDALKSAEKSPFGRRALQDFFSHSNDFLTGEEKFADELETYKQNRANTKITDFKADEAAMDNEYAHIKNEYYPELSRKEYETSLQNIQAALQKATADREIWDNKQYRRQYIAQLLTDQKNQATLASILEMKYNKEYGLMQSDDTFVNLLAVGDLMDDSGFDNGEIATVIKLCQASGVKIMDKLQEVAGWFGLTDHDETKDGDWRLDLDNSPETMSPEEYQKWWSQTRWKRFWSGTRIEYVPDKDSVGNIIYRRVQTM